MVCRLFEKMRTSMYQRQTNKIFLKSEFLKFKVVITQRSIFDRNACFQLNIQLVKFELNIIIANT